MVLMALSLGYLVVSADGVNVSVFGCTVVSADGVSVSVFGIRCGFS